MDVNNIRAIDDLEELAQIISSNSNLIKGFLKENHIPDLSFNKDAPLGFPEAPKEVTQARRDLLDASKKINQLVTGPIDHLVWLSGSYNDTGCLRYVCHYEIPSAIPLVGSISYADLAAKTKTHENTTRRVLRYLMTNNLFHEPEPDHVAHTAGSKLMTIPGPKDLTGYASIDCLPMAAHLVEAHEKWPGSEDPTQTAFNVSSGSSLPVFLEWNKDAIKGPRFARAMTALQSTPGYSIDHVLNGYSWQDLAPDSTIVDVGGSLGQCAKAIATVAPPTTQFIVQDLPQTIAEATSQPLPSSLSSRLTFTPYDFFTPQPPTTTSGPPPSIFFLRFILHDHPDASALSILRNIIPAMTPNSTRLVIMDQIMPPVGAISATDERMLRFMDIQMLIMLNAKERELNEWADLFASASDGKLRILSVKVPEGSAMAVMELVLDP